MRVVFRSLYTYAERNDFCYSPDALYCAKIRCAVFALSVRNGGFAGFARTAPAREVTSLDPQQRNPVSCLPTDECLVETWYHRWEGQKVAHK
jgi:hypothetical protein